MSQENEGIKFAIVAVEYFTKWAKAKPLAKITEQKNDWLHMEVHRMPIRHPSLYCHWQWEIVDNACLANFCVAFGIKKCLSTLHHTTCKLMAKWRPSTKSSNICWRQNLMPSKEDGLKNFPVSYGHTVPPQGLALVKPHFPWDWHPIVPYNHLWLGGESNGLLGRTRPSRRKKKWR